MMLEQTQATINALKECGLARKDFRVHTERLMHGRTFIGYGDIQITLSCSLEKQRAFPSVLAEHFTVTQYILNGKVTGSLRIQVGKPQLIIREL